MSDYQERYGHYAAMAEEALQDALPAPNEDWPDKGTPKILAEAMRYSLFTKGKRLRPVLLLAACHSLLDDLADALPFAAAIEMIHTYSLVHDDLPAMDNDDLRRGKPTNHKVYGEAMAILAGDALLSLAFELMSGSGSKYAMSAMNIIARHCGTSGMIAGQTADIMSQGVQYDPAFVRYIHLRKTADLLTAPLIAGMQLAGAKEEQLQKAEVYGRNLGLAFQITDDLLDVEGNPELTGKTSHRDLELGKLTWPSAVGVEQAKKDARDAVQKALEAAAVFGREQAFFKSLALSIPERVK